MTDTIRSPYRIALYARVSGEEQKQGHNIDSQLAELRQFAAHNNWSIADTYTDEAWSGAALARPALDRLRDDATKGRFDAVLINDVDRLARDVTHLGIIKRDLERSGLSVIFRKIPSENSPTHNLLVNVLGSFAEFERELILDRTRRGKRHKVETRQQFIGAIAPYGYRYTPVRNGVFGTLKVNPEEATIVREAYSWVDVEGLSARKVAERLTRQGLRPRKSGSRWAKSTVLRILRSTVYVGTWYYNKHQRRDTASLFPRRSTEMRPPSHRLRAKEKWIAVKLPQELHIVSEEQWNRVQQRLDQNRCFSPRNSKHEYLLSGLVRCGACTATYAGNPSHGAFQYRCTGRCKRMPLVSEEVLNNTVWTALATVLENPTLLEKALRDTKQPRIPSEGRSKEIQSALENIRTEEARILEAYRLGILTPDQLASEFRSIAGRRQFFDKQQQVNLERAPQVLVQKSVQDFCHDIRQRLFKLSFETKRAVVRIIIRKIVFEGASVRITGIIPYNRASGFAPTLSDGRNLQAAGGIATTATYLPGRNTADNCSVEPGEFLFELLQKIEHDTAKADAARHANLIKANAALAARRLARSLGTQIDQPEKAA